MDGVGLLLRVSEDTGKAPPPSALKSLVISDATVMQSKGGTAGTAFKLHCHCSCKNLLSCYIVTAISVFSVTLSQQWQELVFMIHCHCNKCIFYFSATVLLLFSFYTVIAFSMLYCHSNKCIFDFLLHCHCFLSLLHCNFFFTTL